MPDALALVRGRRAVRFDWVRERFPATLSSQRQLGFLAQELAELVPEVTDRASSWPLRSAPRAASSRPPPPTELLVSYIRDRYTDRP